jgi:hypothetical protein
MNDTTPSAPNVRMLQHQESLPPPYDECMMQLLNEKAPSYREVEASKS